MTLFFGMSGISHPTLWMEMVELTAEVDFTLLLVKLYLEEWFKLMLLPILGKLLLLEKRLDRLQNILES